MRPVKPMMKTPLPVSVTGRSGAVSTAERLPSVAFPSCFSTPLWHRDGNVAALTLFVCIQIRCKRRGCQCPSLTTGCQPRRGYSGPSRCFQILVPVACRYGGPGESTSPLQDGVRFTRRRAGRLERGPARFTSVLRRTGEGPRRGYVRRRFPRGEALCGLRWHAPGTLKLTASMHGWYPIQLVARSHGRGGRTMSLLYGSKPSRPSRPFHHYRSER